jgi:hypothetical protein
MYKWPMQSQYAGRRTKRFFLLRGNTIQYFKNDPSNPTSTSTSTSTTKPQASTPAARRQSTTGVLQSSTEKVVLPRPRTSSFIASAASTLSALISEVASKEDHDGDLDDDGLDGDADGENGPSVSLSLTPDSTVYKGWRYFTPCVTVTTPTDTLWMKTCKQSIVDEAAWMREITRSITLQKKSK